MRKLFLSFLIVLFLATSSFAAELIFLSDFETGNIQCSTCDPDGWSKQACYSYNFDIVTSPVRAGNYALKIFLKQSDSYTCFGDLRPRAQIVKEDPDGMLLQHRQSRWVGYSRFLPDDWPTNEDTALFSFKFNTLSQTNTSGGIKWHVRWGSPGQGQEGSSDVYNEPQTKGEWVDWIVYYYPSWEGDGILKVWRNGILVINESGANCVADRMGWSPLTFLVYKPSWGAGSVELTVYFDEIRMANGPDTQEYYALVDPAQGSGSSAPTITSQAMTSITNTTATGHGTITSTGGVNATKRGICWNTTGSPTVASDKVEESGNFSTGAFSGNMTNLTPDRRIFSKPYGFNTAGYGYGSEVTFDSIISGTYIIDNEDNATGETQSTGDWYSSGGASPYGAGSIYSHEVNATFSFEETLDGNYTVSLWWTEYASRSSSVTVKIYDSGDNLLDTKSVNQTANGGQWNSQGTYDFNATAKVEIFSTGGAGPVSTCADAVKFDYVEGSGGEDSNNPSILEGMNLLGCTPG